MAKKGMEQDGYYIVGRAHTSKHHEALHQDVFVTQDGHTIRMHEEITPDAHGLGLLALGMADAANQREQRGR